MYLLTIKKFILYVLSVTLLLLFSSQGHTGVFGFFNKQDFLLSPAIQGRLVREGKPIAGETISRRLFYGKEYIDKAVTDSAGYFSFPRWSISTSKPSRMFDGDSLSQHIYIEQPDSEEFILWIAQFFFFGDQNSPQLASIFSDLHCDINATLTTYDIPTAVNPDKEFVAYTLCEFNFPAVTETANKEN